MKSKKSLRLVMALIAVTMMAILPSINGQSVYAAPKAEYVCKLAHTHPITAPTQKKALFLKERWEQVTNGRVTVEIYPLGQLCKRGKECLDAASMGTIQMALAPGAWLEPRDREWAITSLPMLIDGPEHWIRVEKSSSYLNDLKTKMEKTGNLKLFSNMVFVSNHVYTKVPITKVTDFSGIKIRAFGAVMTKTFKRVGAAPVDIAAPEVAVALQTGAIKAVMTSLNKGYIQSFGLAENCPYILLTPIGYLIGWWAINADWWNGLPADIRDALEGTADEIRSEVVKIEAEDMSGTIKWAAQNGMKTTELSAQEIAKFRELIQPVYDEYISDVGGKLFDDIVKAR